MARRLQLRSAWWLAACLAPGARASVADLIPADALAVVATEDLAELARRARTLPAVKEFSRDEWAATISHIALLAHGVTDTLPPECLHSGLDVDSVRGAFAALVPDGERSCSVVIGLEGKDGKPPRVAPEFLLYPGAGVEGAVLVVGTRASALDRARAALREGGMHLAGEARFRDALDTWTRPDSGLWIWSDHDALVAAETAGRLDLGALRALLEQRLGVAFAWTLDIVAPDGSDPTQSTTTWIASANAGTNERAALDREALRFVTSGSIWFQTVHWDPARTLELLAEELHRTRVASGMRSLVSDPADGAGFLEMLMSRPQEVLDAADALARDPTAFRTANPNAATLLEVVRPPLVLACRLDRNLLIPPTVACVRVADAERARAAVSHLLNLRDDSDLTPKPWGRFPVYGHSRFSYAIVDDWLVAGSTQGVLDAIDSWRGKTKNIEMDPRFRASFEPLVAQHAEILDLAYCDAPTLLSQRENILLGAMTVWSRYGTTAVDAFALPVLEDLPDVAGASVAIASRTPRGFRIDRLGFLGGEFSGVDGIVGIAAGIAPIVRRAGEVERTIDGVRDELKTLATRSKTFRNIRGHWPTLQELVDLPNVSDDAVTDPWGYAYVVEVVDAHHLRLASLGADAAPGGTGVDFDIELTVRDE